MCLWRHDYSLAEIANAVGRSKSTISRELKRNMICIEDNILRYRASAAQKFYMRRRRKCRKPRILDNPHVFNVVAYCFLEHHWSPEQIEGRLYLEGGSAVSDSTIYRGIALGLLNGLIGGHKAACRLRHKGHRRKDPNDERRGNIIISHSIEERPEIVEERSRIGDWEGDTVAGRRTGACLVTLVDRKSGYLVGGKASSKCAEPVKKVMVRTLKNKPCHTITLDRGKEFADHRSASDALGAEVYFVLPYHPWQRGTNENTNGLLREYFPKGCSLNNVTSKEV
ncbi:IS30 family transposase [Adlercreutzia agrestimuris]|uniref:IS30 family transposase n=1 Tax=Adlercreutzia agrestimuris TaxID=2941324 RepID=UPI0020422D35|nr:IS30 family transposase [Adlercreutzia agrestimuris]